MVEFITSWIIQLIQSTGYVGIFVLMTLESALIPLPSEITMPFAGFLVQQGKLSFWFVVFAGAFGNLIGSLIAYGLGYYLEEHVILKHIRKYGKFLLITEHEYERSLHWLRKYGDAVAFFSRTQLFSARDSWDKLEPYFRQFQMVLGAIFLIFILWYINHKLKIIKLPKLF